MKNHRILAILSIVVIALSIAPFSFALQQEEQIGLLVLELRGGSKQLEVFAISPVDDSMTNPDYELMGLHWATTANYWINPNNRYGFSSSAIVNVLKTSANTWDKETAFAVFSYKGTISRSAGKRDSYNVISFGKYQAGAIAVTYLWYNRYTFQIVETDTKLNTVYGWSLTGETRKMDVQNIMTHEFGHWCGLDDLYGDVDYWLTMYGYGDYGETYKQTLGLGDINGLKAVYRS